MIRILLDTSALIDVFVNRTASVAIRDYVRDKEFFISAITVYEINKAKKVDQRILDFIRNCNILLFSPNSAEISSAVFKKLQEKGKMINEFDILIVGAALENNLMLISKDGDFERIAEVDREFKFRIFH